MSDQTPGPPPPPPDPGQPVPPAPPAQHLPWLAALLSLFFPGIGQIYNRQTTKGAVLLAAYLVIVFITLLLTYCCIGVLLWPLVLAVNIVAVIDAAVVGQKIAEGGAVGEWDFF
ncbi:MAG: DUF5683 domain-containing protein [Armatimonadota bacterium]